MISTLGRLFGFKKFGAGCHMVTLTEALRDHPDGLPPSTIPESDAYYTLLGMRGRYGSPEDAEESIRHIIAQFPEADIGLIRARQRIK